MTASEVDVETETEALVVKDTGYYDMFNVVDLNERTVSDASHVELGVH